MSTNDNSMFFSSEFRNKRPTFAFRDSAIKTNFPIEFLPIVSLFAIDCNFDNSFDFYSDSCRLFISGIYKGKTSELMLRFGGTINNDLIVARVQFIHRREGNMTELYRLLRLIKRTNKCCGAIIIESASTKAIKNWCKKNSFTQDPIYTENYIAPSKED